MIPNFPKFVKVSPSNKSDIEIYTHKFKPYSDFNFVSLCAWDVDEQRRVATLNNGLAVLMTDYATNEPLLSYLGEINDVETILTLINHAKELGIDETLYFIGEESVVNLPKKELVIKEDRKNFDYILSVSQLANYKGRKFSTKRHLAKRFEQENENFTFESVKIDPSLFDSHASPIIKSLVSVDNSHKEELTHEMQAIERLFKNISSKHLLLSTVFVNEEVAGFSIDELLPNKYAISHFFRNNHSFKGVSEFLNNKVAQKLHSFGARYWNWEQDLGLQSLKKMKSGYRPIQFLKKYKISLK